MNFLMVTAPGIFEDDDMKHSDRVRDALRKITGEKVFTSTVVAYDQVESPTQRAERILVKAQEDAFPNIVVYRDDLGAPRVIEALSQLLEKVKNPPQLIRL